MASSAPPQSALASVVNTVPSLPLSLLLLIHLHLLDYPLKNSAEYDAELFSATKRGLRDRTRAMQDITVFLVGRIEAGSHTAKTDGKTSSKTLFPMYPCLKPPDTTSFRTALTKYIEGLRHAAMRRNPGTITASKSNPNLGVPTSSRSNVALGSTSSKLKPSKDLASSSSSSTSSKPTPNANLAITNSPAPEEEGAWWWKDIVVRKSLLEECAGLRFEQLLLAMSTHALFASVATSKDKASLDTAALAYTNLVTCTQHTRAKWVKAASVLSSRGDYIQALRARINITTDPGKYDHLSTVRLTALCASKLQDLHNGLWKGKDGEAALQYLLNLGGLESGSTAAGDENEASTLQEHKADDAAVTIPILPIAAAHHPNHVKRLKRSIFPTAKTKRASNMNDSVTAPPTAKHVEPSENIALAARMSTARSNAQALRDALATANTRKESMVIPVDQPVPVPSAKTVTIGKARARKNLPILSLTNGFERPRVELAGDESRITSELIASLGLTVRGSTDPVLEEAAYESAVATIRQRLTPWPEASRGQFTLVDSSGAQERPPSPPPSPINPAVTRSSRRTSTRFSMARRASLFPTPGLNVGLDLREEEDDEVQRIVNDINDDSLELDLENHERTQQPWPTPTPTTAASQSVFLTPKPQTRTLPPSTSRSTRLDTVRRPKQSFQMPVPAFALPSLVHMAGPEEDVGEEMFGDEEEDGDFEGGEQRDEEEQTDGINEEEDYVTEAPSMTLRDILLRAVDGDEALQFGLLGDEDEDEEDLDGSFTWG